MEYNKKNIAIVILVALTLTIGFTSINGYARGISSHVSSHSSSRSFSRSYSRSTNTRFSTTNKYSSPKTSSTAKLNLSKEVLVQLLKKVYSMFLAGKIKLQTM